MKTLLLALLISIFGSPVYSMDYPDASFFEIAGEVESNIQMAIRYNTYQNETVERAYNSFLACHLEDVCVIVDIASYLGRLRGLHYLHAEVEGTGELLRGTSEEFTQVLSILITIGEALFESQAT